MAAKNKKLTKKLKKKDIEKLEATSAVGAATSIACTNDVNVTNDVNHTTHNVNDTVANHNLNHNLNHNTNVTTGGTETESDWL